MFEIMIVYKVNNGQIWSISNEADDYILQENEYGSSVWYQKPLFTGSEVIESITQQEIDDRAELEQENQYLRETIAQLNDGNSLALDIFSFVRRHDGLTTNQRGVLKGLAILLFQGDIEQSKADFDAIQRPTQAGKMQKIYDRLKLRFDAL